MKNLVIGTAGHIDHGKTTLIKALTGIETDTSQEEKKRGLSINLGFAYLDLKDGERVGIVDVPGHERFIKNMLAGAAGIDLVLLVIDANEGIMPQTVEHLAVLQLLGIENFIIVLSKVESVDPELLELVKEDVRDQLADSALEDAPMIETDAVTGFGIDELRETIEDKLSQMQDEKADLPARLNVDRAFSVRGFGTVVTGTLLDGVLEVGDDLTIYPANIPTRVRSIQIHEEEQSRAHAGNRTAINLTKVDLEDVHRGDVLSAAPLEASYMLDAKVTCLPRALKPMELWDRVHVYIGTRELNARIVPLGQERIMPGESGFLQLRLEEEIAVKKGDRFILRNFSPVVTIGGGEVLDAKPVKHRRYNEEVLESLEIMEKGQTEDLLLYFLEHRSAGFTSIREMAEYLTEPMQEVETLVRQLVDEDRLIQHGQFYMSRYLEEKLANDMLDLLTAYHKDHPLATGMPLEEFRSRQAHLPPREMNAIIQRLVDENKIVVSEDIIKLADFSVAMTEEQKKMKEMIEKQIFDAGYSLLTEDEIVQNNADRKQVYRQMLETDFYRIDRQYAIHKKLYNEALDLLHDYCKEHGTIELAAYRNLLNTSRRNTLLLLDHFDDLEITRRVDDKRLLNPKYLNAIEEVYA